MVGLILAGAAVVIFGGLYVAGVVEARLEMRQRGQWVDPPRPLPRARALSRHS